MRAILIDPETKTFTEIQIADDIDGIQKVLRCGRFTTGARPLRGSLLTGFDTLYVSDDSPEDREGQGFWFQVDADRDPPSSYPIAGPGLAYGIDSNGAACDVGISVAATRGPETWSWSLAGVARPDDPDFVWRGEADSETEAFDAFADCWARWLEWAGLEQVGDLQR